MKTDIKVIASFLSTAIWADGEYDEAEKETVGAIAEAFELDVPAFEKAIETAIAEIKDFSEEQVNEYLVKNAVEVEEEEINHIFEAALELVLVDGVLARDEVTNLLSMADALGIDTEDAILMLSDKIKEEEELEIEF